MPVSTIVSNGTLPVLTINGREVDPCGYMSYQAEKADYKGFVRAGYKLLFVPDEGREIPVQTRDYNRFRSVETANALVRLAAEAKPRRAPVSPSGDTMKLNSAQGWGDCMKLAQRPSP